MTIHNDTESETASALADLLLSQMEGKVMDLESDLASRYFEIVHALDHYKRTSMNGTYPKGGGSR
ncbi:MAG: hypothetical protein HQL83_04780 [Magnetococcales bacterium]|nr:hypothetical protein [Magnetococcales bacterium]